MLFFGQKGSTAKHQRKEAMIAMMVVLLVLMLVQGTNLFAKFELATLDQRFVLRGKQPPQPNVVIVSIDDASIGELGRFPWPRSVHAQLVDRLREAGAAAIGFDVLFPEPDKDHPEGDAALAQAAFRAGNVFFPLYGEYNPAKTTSRGTVWEYDKMVPPLPELVRAAAGIGFTDVPADLDSVYRRPCMFARHGDAIYPHFALEIARFVFNLPEDQIKVELGKVINVGDRAVIPINKAARTLINFAGGDHTYPRFSYADVLKNRIAKDVYDFKDKIVLIGATAAGLYDIRANPFEPRFFGVETNANIIGNILESNFLRRTSDLSNNLMIVLFGVLIGFLVPRLRPVMGGVLAFNLLVVYSLIAFYAFNALNLDMDMVPQATTVFLGYLGITGYKLSVEEKEKRKIRSQFGVYVPKRVVDQIVEDPSKAKLGGNRCQVSILFSDIRNFTTMSEQMDAVAVVSMLNEYFTVMNEIIFKYEGTLDKFIGDAIMVFWNAPGEQLDHALRAVTTAVEMRRGLGGLQKKWIVEGKPAFEIGIGINTGEAVIGNIGSEQRMQYTAIGDNVNLASRLEGLNKNYEGCRIIISEETYKLVEDRVVANLLDTVTVKGKTKPVAIFQVTDVKPAAAAG